MSVEGIKGYDVLAVIKKLKRGELRMLRVCKVHGCTNLSKESQQLDAYLSRIIEVRLLYQLSLQFQNFMSKHYFLFVLLLSIATRSQVLAPTGNCLGNCITCDPLSLAKCKGSQPCDWGFYAPQTDSTCIPQPSTQIVSTELSQSTVKPGKLAPDGWSQGSETLSCQYLSPEGNRYIEALGFFKGVEMLQKTFKVDPSSEVFDLSFNLLHDEWLPFNDFLIIDISSQNKNIDTVEISFDKKISITSQPAAINCAGVRVISHKFNIKIQNAKGIVGSNITVLFTSFLYSASWAVSNVRLVSGCIEYTLFNATSGKCDKCDKDSFSITSADASWCKKCPQLCLTCQSSTKCTTCVEGATLNSSGLCSFSEKFKTQLFDISNSSSCDGVPLRIGSISSGILFPELKNEQNLLYDQIQIGFILYYLPLDWQSTSNGSYISVTINKIEVMQLDYRNMTNAGINLCNSFQKGRTARIQIFSKSIVHTDNVISLEFTLKGKVDKQFGVGNLMVKSIRKDKPVSLQPSTINHQITNTTAVPMVDTLGNATNSPKLNDSLQLVEPMATEPSSNPNATINSSKNVVILQPVDHLLAQDKSNEQAADRLQTNISKQQLNNSNIQSEVPIQKTDQTILIQGQPKFSPNNLSQQKQFKPNINVNDSSIQNESTWQQNPTKMGYLPTSSGKKSGLQVYIDNEPEGQYLYNVSIDKLNQNEYNLDSYYLQDGRINMFININSSFTQGTVSVYRYAASRLLQQIGSRVLVGTFKIARFDSLNQGHIQSLQNFATLFQISAWIGVILILMAVICGYGIVVEEYILALQVIFLHAYIASDYLPLTFRDTIGGLSLIENLNFFIPSHSKSIQNQWMGNVLQTGPVRFYLFNTDINFLRQFFPIIIVNIIYLIWFGCVALARRFLSANLIDQQKGLHHKLMDNIACRVINFVDQIWRYQFLATMWFCLIQFYNLSYPQGSNRSEAINAIICILAFICGLAWPAFVTYHCRKEYYECEYSEYLYKFQDIYYMKIPQYQLPSNHHRLGYNLFKTVKFFLIALTVCYFGNVATLTLLVLILVHVLEIVYIKYQQIYTDKRYFLLKVIENSVFTAIELGLLALLNFSSFAGSEAYIYIGFVLAGVAVLIIINAAVRVGYIIFSRYRQLMDQHYEVQEGEKKMKTERVV